MLHQHTQMVCVKRSHSWFGVTASPGGFWAALLTQLQKASTRHVSQHHRQGCASHHQQKTPISENTSWPPRSFSLLPEIKAATDVLTTLIFFFFKSFEKASCQRTAGNDCPKHSWLSWQPSKYGHCTKSLTWRS